MARTSTDLGEIEGIDLDGCERYAGIRYAQPPIGELRFKAPVPSGPWEGVYDASAFGASAPQPPPVVGTVGVQADLHTDEDCLFLNVFTPCADGGARPVMVWIHGGAYTIGSGDIYDGSSFCTRGDVVVVTMNYRLGVLGWIPLEHLDPTDATLAGAGSNGVRDQIESLRWVRDNIAAFGGDPGNVTLFGESAGGGSVAAVLAAPSADGLYHRAIIQSGPPGFAPPWRPELYTTELLAALGAPDGGIDALRAADAAALVQAQIDIGLIDRMGRDRDHPVDGTGVGPHPTVDGVVITATPAEAVRAKGAAAVPLLIGTNEDEGTLFSLLLPTDVSDDELAAAMPENISDPHALFQAYRERENGRRLIIDLMTDAVFRIPSLRLADAQVEAGAPAWVYLFTWRTPVFGGLLGATHALEIPFVWDMLDDPQWGLFIGTDPPKDLGVAMQDAWLAFARSGSPEAEGLPAWPRYETAARPTFEFGDERLVVDDPGGDLRRLWYDLSTPA